MASQVTEPKSNTVISPIQSNIIDAYDEQQSKNFIYLMTAIHESFDDILKLRHSGHTFFGRTLTTFQSELHLDNILNNIVPAEPGILTIADVRDFLIKDFNDDDINKASGILGWACINYSPLKAIEVVNPKHDLFDKWIKVHNGPATVNRKNYSAFLQSQNIKKEIISFNGMNDTTIKKTLSNTHYSECLFGNLKNFITQKIINDEWKNRANGWMELPDKTPFNRDNHHIVFQEIATVNYRLWKDSDIAETDYHLFMRGAEIIAKNIENSGIVVGNPNASKGEKSYVSILPFDHIYFPPSHGGLQNLHLLTRITPDSNQYFEYNDSNKTDPLDKINTFNSNFGVDSKRFNRTLYQMVIREEYRHQGLPRAQQYLSTNTGISSTTSTAIQKFQPTPYYKDGLICSLCTRPIDLAGKGTEDDEWTNELGTRQAYDVDHLLNLIFNDLFNLNTIPHGIGFTNTCDNCNRAFKSEKIWSPSLALWELLITKGGLSDEYKNGNYLWPGRNMEGVKIRKRPAEKPFEGYRAFTIENIRMDLKEQLNKDNDFAIEIHNTRIKKNVYEDANNSQGLTWKNKKADPKTRTFDNNNNDITVKSFKDIEEIFLNRIMKLIELRNNDNTDEKGNVTLVKSVLDAETKRTNTGSTPIIAKYVESIKKWPVIDVIINTLMQQDSQVQSIEQLNAILQNIKTDNELLQGGISNLVKSGSIIPPGSKSVKITNKYAWLINDTRKNIVRDVRYAPETRRSRILQQVNSITSKPAQESTWKELVQIHNNLKKYVDSGSGSGTGTMMMSMDGASSRKKALKVSETHAKNQKKSLAAAWMQPRSGNTSNLTVGTIGRLTEDQYTNIQKLDNSFKSKYGDGSNISKELSETQGTNAFHDFKDKLENVRTHFCNEIAQYADTERGIAERSKERDYQEFKTAEANVANLKIKKNLELEKEQTQETQKQIEKLLVDMKTEKEKRERYQVKYFGHRRREKYYEAMRNAANSCDDGKKTGDVTDSIVRSTHSLALENEYCNETKDCEKPLLCINHTCQMPVFTNLPPVLENDDVVMSTGIVTSPITTTGKRKKEDDPDGNPRKEKGKSFRGGNKTRKNRRRKNRTKRKKKNKKHTKKHRRRKNKTRYKR